MSSILNNYDSNLQISLQDENSLSSLMLSVKLHGFDYMPGTEVVCVCYRIYYKLLHTLNPMCKVIDFKNETILIETNFDKSKVVTRRPIKWEEIDFPQEWVIENATQSQNNINTEVSEIEQLNDGTVKIRFHEPSKILIDNRSRSMSSRSNSSYISHVDYIGGGVEPIDAENIIEGEPSNKNEFYDNLNKISEKYARKPEEVVSCYEQPSLVTFYLSR
ncbi:hypothetical protein H5410_010993 [Solanum commersonii]|uniref:Uncharacterized protein n=1 Tax=Solanum commersonii TaxID=4109 RepID=A0A9J6ANZ1_SOLCO|nr:hypothetical protein H5410_010993 [Solanum commersonii]